MSVRTASAVAEAQNVDTNPLQYAEEINIETSGGQAGDNIAMGAGNTVELSQQMKNQLIDREYVMQWEGSLDELHRNPAKCTWSVSKGVQPIFQSRTRHGMGDDKLAERAGDLSKVCLVGMQITKIDSTFPCDVALCIAGAKGNVYSSSGEQFAAMISPNERQHNMQKVVVKPSPYMNSAYMQLYPGMTSSNLRTDKIMSVPGENYCFVDQSHPIVEPVRHPLLFLRTPRCVKRRFSFESLLPFVAG